MRKFKVTVWDSMTGETSIHDVEVQCSTWNMTSAIHAAVQKDIGVDMGTWKYSTSVMDMRLPLSGVAIWTSNLGTVSSENFIETT